MLSILAQTIPTNDYPPTDIDLNEATTKLAETGADSMTLVYLGLALLLLGIVFVVATRKRNARRYY